MPIPETRPSLILRIRDSEDREAWDEFVAIYQPVIFQLAKYHGMQSADAEDLTQQVLMAVSRAIASFKPDHSQARFRTWLKTIARRAIINALTRGPLDRGSGNEEMTGLLEALPTDQAETRELVMEYRKQVFYCAADRVRNEFQTQTWKAFWMSCVEDRSVVDVADALGVSRGSIYTSRSRVMKRLQEVVQELDADFDGERR